jgi:hypothetical protein
MTDMYGGQWPVVVDSAFGTVPSILKWTHSIIHEHNFKSEWQARENARGLAFEMAPEGQLTMLSKFPSRSSSYVRRGSSKKVSFTFDDPDLRCVNPNQHSSAVTVPGILKYKPNPADIAQLPDPDGPQDGAPHQTHQSAIGSRNLLDRPYWQQQVWQRLQEEGIAEDADGELVFYMNSYYICHLTNRRQDRGRPLRFDSDINEWEASMRFMWEDFVNPALPLYVHFVLPEPPITLMPGTIGTLLLVQNPTLLRAACLTTVIEPALPRLRVTEIAHSFDLILPFRHILLHAGVDEVCDARRSQGIGQCDILVGNRVLPHGDPVRVHEGLGLVVQVPPPRPPLEWENVVRAHYDTPFPQQWTSDDDTTSFLAHHTQPHQPTIAVIDDPSAARDPHDPEILADTDTASDCTSFDEEETCTGVWRDTTVFTINGIVGQIVLPWHRFHDFPSMLRPLLGISDNEEVFAYSVDHPPADLDVQDRECLVVRTNLQPPSSHILRLILVDIEVYLAGEVQPTTYARRPTWMPHTANRLSIFRLLGLEEHYQEDRMRCHLWVNRIWVDPEVDVPVHFDHGDSIIAIIADEHLINELTSDDAGDQDSMSLFQQRRHNPIVCQSEHNISDFAAVSSNNSVPRQLPQMPMRRFVNGDWNRELYNRFLRHAAVEMEEEGPVAYVVTWLLQEHRQPSCWTPRVVKLTEDHTAWSDLIVTAWQDLFDYNQLCEAHWVHPTPAQSSFSTTIGHIILEQNVNDQLASIVITTHRFRRQGQFIAQAAHLVPCLLHRRTVLEKIILYPEEEQFRPFCQVRWGALPFGVVGMPLEPDIVQSGVGLDVLLPAHAFTPPSLDAPTIFGEAMHQHDNEDAVFMQTTHPSMTAPEDSTTTSTPMAACPSAPSFSFDPDAPAFVPGQSDLAAQPEFIQELHDNWRSTAFSWEDETPSCSILVWMVDHSWTEPHSYLPRSVRLYPDFTTWEDQIVNAWHDLLQPGLPRELHLVYPTPPTSDNTIAAHVIVIQQPRDDWVTSVVTCLDSTNQHQTMQQAAVTTHEHILLDNLLRIFNLYHACVGQGATHACAAWYNRLPLLLNAPLMGRSGYGIVMFVRTAGAFPSADAITLLQRSATVSRTRERLTTDVVAHAQWPLEPSVTKPALQLAELIMPPTLIQVDFRSVEAMRNTIFNLDLGSVQSRASVVKWHQATQDLMDLIPDWQGELPCGISFFTDGSATNFHDQRRSSAAVVRVIHTAYGDRFGGFRCYDTSANGFAPHAEAAAILTAVLWTAQMCELTPHLQGSTFCFHFDCMFAGMSA